MSRLGESESDAWSGVAPLKNPPGMSKMRRGRRFRTLSGTRELLQYELFAGRVCGERLDVTK